MLHQFTSRSRRRPISSPRLRPPPLRDATQPLFAGRHLRRRCSLPPPLRNATSRPSQHPSHPVATQLAYTLLSIPSLPPLIRSTTRPASQQLNSRRPPSQ
ncbi:unnamed protein product [Linum trigynum]|uniref:Uncharacterized protein n=1 Tax=Linum trigynum TaxID=586398 RepID=A0AAV2FTR3_9ROSI